MAARVHGFAVGTHAFAMLLPKMRAAFAIPRVPVHVLAAAPGMRVPRHVALVRQFKGH